ncbi:DUF692 domain-containing protein [Stappia sp. F7233]|uniref:UPF0276 protein H2509_09375 n=1 Tax=Stappia albiluteola TaxID=2758565 RepID=A0A839ADX7_9HYPH|nr:DUF692 domain-containing protein [Stappia albiluteola]MBA5777336.1 DUF692 domain-containing protein [Stappia albiluteola]
MAGNGRAWLVEAGLPARAGVGLKAEHYHAILDQRPDIGFFEIHAENYMGAGGPPHAYLSAIRDAYPISLHGVGLSIGALGPLDGAHLSRLRQVAERYEPGLFSEHLAWSTHDTAYYNDLLPVPYDRETLDRVCDHIDQVQEALGRRMLLENPSTYVAFEQSSMSELDFLREVVSRTGCGLLLDVNNVYVSAVNHQTSPEAYLDAFPFEAVGEIHLGGHAPDTDDEGGPLLIDAHDRAVDEAVWALYERVIERVGQVPTLVEWDNDVPEWSVLYGQAQAAEAIMASVSRSRRHAASA